MGVVVCSGDTRPLPRISPLTHVGAPAGLTPRSAASRSAVTILKSQQRRPCVFIWHWALEATQPHLGTCVHPPHPLTPGRSPGPQFNVWIQSSSHASWVTWGRLTEPPFPGLERMGITTAPISDTVSVQTWPGALGVHMMGARQVVSSLLTPCCSSQVFAHRLLSSPPCLVTGGRGEGGRAEGMEEVRGRLLLKWERKSGLELEPAEAKRWQAASCQLKIRSPPAMEGEWGLQGPPQTGESHLQPGSPQRSLAGR